MMQSRLRHSYRLRWIDGVRQRNHEELNPPLAEGRLGIGTLPKAIAVGSKVGGSQPTIPHGPTDSLEVRPCPPCHLVQGARVERRFFRTVGCGLGVVATRWQGTCQ